MGGYGHIGKWIQEDTIFMRVCCCFKWSKKIEKLSNKLLTHAANTCHHQMHADWSSAVG